MNLAILPPKFVTLVFQLYRFYSVNNTIILVLYNPTNIYVTIFSWLSHRFVFSEGLFQVVHV